MFFLARMQKDTAENMTTRNLSRMLDAAYGMMGFVTAVQNREGRVVRLDWRHRVDVLPAARDALGAALDTPWARMLLARILDVPLDMDARHFSRDGQPFVACDSLGDSAHGNRLLIVQLPDGRIDLVTTCGDATVASVRDRIQGDVRDPSRMTLFLSTTGRALHDSEVVSRVCEDETFVLDAIDEPEGGEWQMLLDTQALSIRLRTPRITAELMLPLCWKRPGRQVTVWRKREALAAVAVARHAGIKHMLPLLLKHLAIPPRDWLRGPDVQGRVDRAMEGDTITFTFVPDEPLSPKDRLRLCMEGGREWFDE